MSRQTHFLVFHSSQGEIMAVGESARSASKRCGTALAEGLQVAFAAPALVTVATAPVLENTLKALASQTLNIHAAFSQMST